MLAILSDSLKGVNAVAALVAIEAASAFGIVKAAAKNAIHAACSTIAGATKPLVKMRGTVVDFPRYSGKAGETKQLTVFPQAGFWSQRLVATDSARRAGYGTSIGHVMVGGRNQRPGTTGSTMTAFLGAGSIGTGLTFERCERWESISIEVHFSEDCDFDASLFGYMEIAS